MPWMRWIDDTSKGSFRMWIGIPWPFPKRGWELLSLEWGSGIGVEMPIHLGGVFEPTISRNMEMGLWVTELSVADVHSMRSCQA